MDYANGTELWKYQWDLIHNPETILLGAYNEEDGAKENNTVIPVNTAQWLSPPVGESDLTFLTPSGLPFHAKGVTQLYVANASLNLSANADGFLVPSTDDSDMKIVHVAKGCVLAFKVGDKVYSAWSNVISKEIQGNETATGMYFWGYKSAEEERCLQDVISPANSTHQVWMAFGDEWICRKYDLELKEYLMSGQETYYTGAGTFANDIEQKLKLAGLPFELRHFTSLSRVDIYGHTVWAKFNYFGQKGLLQKVVKDNENFYIYTVSDANNPDIKHYYEYDESVNLWRHFTPDKIRISDLLDYDFIKQAYADFENVAHATLDGIGFIPVLGEAADLVHGFWYMAKGEFGDMALCFGSCIPVIGDATFKGAKYLNIALDLRNVAKTLNLNGQAAESFNRIAKLLQTADKAVFHQCLTKVGTLLSDYPAHIKTIERLVSELPEAEKLKSVLDKLNEMGGTAAVFFDDIAQMNASAKSLANSLDELSDRVLDAWAFVRPSVGRQGGFTQFALDMPTLNRVADYLSPANAEKLKSIGGREGLAVFISKNSDVPCASCGTGGINVFAGRTLDNMIQNYVEVAHAFRNHPDLWGKLSQGVNHSLPAMREGTQHTLEVFRNNPSKYSPNNIEAIDLKFEDLPDNIDICDLCRYDVKFTPEAVRDFGAPRLAEFKSYAVGTWTNLAANTKFVEQFKRYLAAAEITKIDDLAYVVNTSKASVAEVKSAFKALFEAKPDEVFKSMSSSLKSELGLTGLNARSKFNDLIKDETSKLYSFIKSN